MILTLSKDNSIHDLTNLNNTKQGNLLKNEPINKKKIIISDAYNKHTDNPVFESKINNNNADNYNDPQHISPWYDPSLYKTHVLADLTNLPSLGLRWRTKSEVLSGKGLFTCGNLYCKPYTKKTIPEILKLIQSKKCQERLKWYNSQKAKTDQEELELLHKVPHGMGVREYSVHFGFVENGKLVEELVRLVLCLRCSVVFFENYGGALGAKLARHQFKNWV